MPGQSRTECSQEILSRRAEQKQVIQTNSKTLSLSKKLEKKVLLKVQELRSSFQRIQGCLHQTLFLQNVNHFSLKGSWDHSAVGISATSNAKNTKSSEVGSGMLSALDLSTWSLCLLHLLTKSRSCHLSGQPVQECRTGPTLHTHTPQKLLLLHSSSIVNIWFFLTF